MHHLRTSGAPMLTIRRTFAAPRSRVYAAWSDAQILRQWFPPDGKMTSADWDPRPDATYRFTMIVKDDEEWAVGGVFSEVRAPERLAFTFRWEEDDPALERDTFVTVDFIERGSETEMIFTHTGLRDDASRDSHTEGWSMSFDKIAKVLG